MWDTAQRTGPFPFTQGRMSSIRRTSLPAKMGAAAVLTIITVVGACSSPSNTGRASDQTGSGLDATASGACAPGHPGCPCSTPGQTIDCGQVVHDYGSYVTC